MTSAIDNVVRVTADRADTRRDVEKMTSGSEDSIGIGVRIVTDQIKRRAWSGRREDSAAMEPLRVLIVEQDPEIGRLLTEILEELGHAVRAVEVDAAAISAKCRDVDLIIVDIGLGETTGIAAVEQILKEGLAPHVVVIGDLLRGLALAPEVTLIQKPFRGSDLIAAIARTTGGGAKRNEPVSV